jgi:hypothetical protein
MSAPIREMASIFKAVLVKGGREVEDAGRLRKVRRRERRVGDVIFWVADAEKLGGCW